MSSNSRQRPPLCFAAICPGYSPPCSYKRLARDACHPAHPSALNCPLTQARRKSLPSARCYLTTCLRWITTSIISCHSASNGLLSTRVPSIRTSWAFLSTRMISFLEICTQAIRARGREGPRPLRSTRSPQTRYSHLLALPGRSHSTKSPIRSICPLRIVLSAMLELEYRHQGSTRRLGTSIISFMAPPN